MLDSMRKLPWIIGLVVVLIAIVVAAPFIYKAVRGGDDAPAATVSTEGVEAAVGDLDGTWTVVPGTDPNSTSAGYTVNEVLRGEPVTVVGTTGAVTGEADFSGTTLESARFEVEVASLATDSGQRDNQARSASILDSQKYPVATLSLSEPVDLADIPADGSTATVSMEIDLTVKGTTVTSPVEVTVLRSGDRLVTSGAVPLPWSEVGVVPPDLGFVKVEPEGTVDFLVVLAQD